MQGDPGRCPVSVSRVSLGAIPGEEGEESGEWEESEEGDEGG
jgi:hypothetical protein